MDKLNKIEQKLQEMSEILSLPKETIRKMAVIRSKELNNLLNERMKLYGFK